MGVCIQAYVNIKKKDAVEGEYDDSMNHIKAYVNPDFTGRADDIKNGACYEFDDVEDGLSLSYGGYNLWRNELAKLAGWPIYPELSDNPKQSYAASAWRASGGPFWELINFADNEGVIGGAVSAKLAKDFSDYQVKADEHHDEFFRTIYSQMRKCFEAAANSGLVNFSSLLDALVNKYISQSTKQPKGVQ